MDRQPSWVAVDTDGVVVDAFALSNTVHAVGRREAAGHATAGAGVVLMAVDDRGHVDSTDVELAGPVRSIVRSDSGALLVVGGRPPSLVLWCHHRGGGVVGRSPDHLEVWRSPSVPPDAVRTWATDGEDEIYVSEHADGRLTAFDPGISRRAPEGGAASLRVGGGDLVVGAGQSHVVAAGVLGPPDRPPSTSVWWIHTDDLGPDLDRGGWQELVLEPSPDGVTDVLEGYVVAIAGHVGLRPVVFDDLGRLLESPSVALDAAHPQVLLVDSGSRGRSAYGDTRVPGSPPIVSVGLRIAVQSRDDGPQLWTRGEDRWQVLDLPGSHLEDIAVPWSRPAPWLLVDGTLWRPTST